MIRTRPAAGIFERLDLQRRDQDDSRRIKVLASNHRQVSTFLGERKLDRARLVVVIGTRAQGDGLLDQRGDSRQVDAGDPVQVAPGEIKLHQVDRVNLDVDLGDVAEVEADARLRGRARARARSRPTTSITRKPRCGFSPAGRSATTGAAGGPDDRHFGHLQVLAGIGLDRAGGVAEAIGDLLVVLERLGGLPAGVVDLAQDVDSLPLVRARLIGTGGILVGRICDRLRNFDRPVVLAEVEIGQGIGVLEAVEERALGIKLGEPGRQLVDRLEVFELDVGAPRARGWPRRPPGSWASRPGRPGSCGSTAKAAAIA